MKGLATAVVLMVLLGVLMPDLVDARRGRKEDNRAVTLRRSDIGRMFDKHGVTIPEYNVGGIRRIKTVRSGRSTGRHPSRSTGRPRPRRGGRHGQGMRLASWDRIARRPSRCGWRGCSTGRIRPSRVAAVDVARRPRRCRPWEYRCRSMACCRNRPRYGWGGRSMPVGRVQSIHEPVH